MTVKRTPATPLPWIAQAWTSHAASTVIVADPSSPTGKRRVAEAEAFDGKTRETDAAYLVHAANAYPIAVRRVKDAVRFIEEGAPLSAKAGLLALLREIGEDQ